MLQGMKTCLLKIATPLSRLYMQWHCYHRSGDFPLPGGTLMQPLKYLDAMGVLDAVEAESREEHHARK
jgi:hypothetical protein